MLSVAFDDDEVGSSTDSVGWIALPWRSSLGSDHFTFSFSRHRLEFQLPIPQVGTPLLLNPSIKPKLTPLAYRVCIATSGMSSAGDSNHHRPGSGQNLSHGARMASRLSKDSSPREFPSDFFDRLRTRASRVGLCPFKST